MFIAGKRIDLQKLRLIRVIHVTNVCSFWYLVPSQMPQGSSAWQAELWSIFIPIWNTVLMCQPVSPPHHVSLCSFFSSRCQVTTFMVGYGAVWDFVPLISCA